MLYPAGPSRPGRLLLTLPLLALLVTCIIGPRQPKPGEIGSECADDSVCNSGYCLVEPSFPGSYCSLECSSEEVTCPDGSSCEGYYGYRFCLDSCGGDEECREGYLCDYGSCRPPCVEDRGCKEGDTCVEGRCKPPCQGDGDCAEKERCQAGKCLPPCSGDKDCLPGTVCNAETGRCDDKPGKKLGELCTGSPECSTDYCLPTRGICSVQCTASARCPTGWVCGLEKIDEDHNDAFEKVEADCVPATGKAKVGANCEKDDDCASAHCYDGFCMEACVGDPDCGPGNQCLGVNIVLDGGAIQPYSGCLPRKGVGNFLVGTFPGAGSMRWLDIPPNAQSFVLSAEVPSTSDYPFVGQLKDPQGTALNDAQSACQMYTAPIRFMPQEQQQSIFVSNNSSVTAKPGVYRFSVAAASSTGLPQPSTQVTMRLLLKIGRAEKGTLNINWFFVDLSPGWGFCVPGARLDAAGAMSHPWFTKVRNNMAAIFKSAGLTLGKETFNDLKNAALDAIQVSTTGSSTEVQELFSSSKGMQGSSINVFVVRKIEVTGMAGIILGMAGGIPGPIAQHGLVHSGVMLSAEAACFEPFGVSTGHVLAHELGHYLGLFHTVEQETHPGLDGGKVLCPCPCGPNMVCQSGSGLSWCRATDPIADTDNGQNNLMFYTAESSQTFAASQLSPGQIRVVLDNPIVGH